MSVFRRRRALRHLFPAHDGRSVQVRGGDQETRGHQHRVSVEPSGRVHRLLHHLLPGGSVPLVHSQVAGGTLRQEAQEPQPGQQDHNAPDDQQNIAQQTEGERLHHRQRKAGAGERSQRTERRDVQHHLQRGRRESEEQGAMSGGGHSRSGK